MRGAAVALALLAGCGTSGPMIVGSDDGGDLSVADAVVPPDLACLPGLPTAMVACGASACAAGQVCCYPTGSTAGACASCCPSGQLGVQCTTPADCGGKPCCLQLEHSQPTLAYCTVRQDECSSSLSVGSLAGLTGQTRLCTIDADCTTGAADSPFKTCCTSTFLGATQKVCFTRGMTAPGITCP